MLQSRVSTPLFALCSPLLLALGAAAQTVVVPSSVQTANPQTQGGTFYNGNFFYGTSSTTTAKDSHGQAIYATSDITVPVAVWNGMSVRRPSGLGNSNPAASFNLVVKVSVSPNTHLQTTTNFANNAGPSPVTVLNGPINLPAATNGTWPMAWQQIPWTTPYTYVGASGNTLVVDTLMTGNTATSAWYCEVAPRNPNTGTRAENGGPQSSCKFSTGTYNSGLGYTLPTVGGSWRLSSMSGLLANAPGTLALGFTGVGGMWAGVPLPINLATYGAPGCSWNIAPFYSIAVTASASGSAGWPAAIPIPNNPSWAGAVFYDHGVFLDAAANAWGVVTTWSSKWTIGSGIAVGAPAATVTVVGNTAQTATTGSLTQLQGLSLQLY